MCTTSFRMSMVPVQQHELAAWTCKMKLGKNKFTSCYHVVVSSAFVFYGHWKTNRQDSIPVTEFRFWSVSSGLQPTAMVISGLSPESSNHKTKLTLYLYVWFLPDCRVVFNRIETAQEDDVWCMSIHGMFKTVQVLQLPTLHWCALISLAISQHCLLKKGEREVTRSSLKNCIAKER